MRESAQLCSLRDRHVEHVRICPCTRPPGFRGCSPSTVAGLAGDVRVRQEVHLDLQRAVAALQDSWRPPLTLKEKRPDRSRTFASCVSAKACGWSPRAGRRIRARRTTDWARPHVRVELFDARDRAVAAGLAAPLRRDASVR